MAIPDTYERIEYLESSGTQYINTGIIPSSYNGTLCISADAQFLATPTDNSAVFGSGRYNSTASSRRTILAGASTTNFVFLNGVRPGTVIASSAVDTNRHIFTVDQPNKKYKLDDTEIAFTTTGSDKTYTTGILLFAGINSDVGSASIAYYSTIRMYEYYLTNSGSPLQNFVPVRRVSDGALGMYDYVTGNFFANSGSGTFTAGGDVKHTLTLVNMNPNFGTVSGDGTYWDDREFQISSSANSGYSLMGWYNQDGICVSTSATPTLTITEDTTLYAYFGGICTLL